MNRVPIIPPRNRRKQARKRVLIFASTASMVARERLAGILRYAGTMGNWEVLVLNEVLTAYTLRQMRDFKPNGVILNEHFYTELVQRKALPACPLVLFTDNTDRSYGETPCIQADETAIGTAAATYFLKKKYANIAVVGLRPWTHFFADQRVRSFNETIEQAGLPTPHFYGETLPEHGETCVLNRRALGNFLLNLPKPCAIFAISDDFAWQVLQACTDLGIFVSGHVTLLGCDNNEAICRAAEPRLSSVAPDHEAGGYLAGKVLSRLFWGREKSVVGRCFPYGVKGVVERESTLDPTGVNNTIVRARAFIAQHYTERISVVDVARATHISKRTLNMHFSQSSAKSVHNEILTARLKHLLKLLARPNMPIREATQKSGFHSENHAKAVFKARFGMTMREYRENPIRRNAAIFP